MMSEIKNKQKTQQYTFGVCSVPATLGGLSWPTQMKGQ